MAEVMIDWDMGRVARLPLLGDLPAALLESLPMPRTPKLARGGRGGRSNGPYADSLRPSSEIEGGGGGVLGSAEGQGGTRTPTYKA